MHANLCSIQQNNKSFEFCVFWMKMNSYIYQFWRLYCTLFWKIYAAREKSSNWNLFSREWTQRGGRQRWSYTAEEKHQHWRSEIRCMYHYCYKIPFCTFWFNSNFPFFFAVIIFGSYCLYFTCHYCRTMQSGNKNRNTRIYK